MTLDLIKIRRDLHQIPEIGLEEFKTQAYLLERIAEMTEGKDFVVLYPPCVRSRRGGGGNPAVGTAPRAGPHQAGAPPV